MRRIAPWIGLVLLTISFVWFIHLPAPVWRAAVARKSAPHAQEPVAIVLDAGHGGVDSGAMCGAVMEKDLTLDVARRTERLLREEGYATILTRADDRYLSLGERAAIANRQKNALFVSIHFNDENARVSGVETYYAPRAASRFGFLSWLPFLEQDKAAPLTAQSETLARFLQSALIERTQAPDRGTKAERFFVIANVRHPAALVEGGFITNKAELTKLSAGEYREELASAISTGIGRYRSSLQQNRATLAVAAAGSE